jgi:hypothetical protein
LLNEQRSSSEKPIGLGSLLFGAARRDLLALFLLHPEFSAHVRELGRVTGRAPGTLLRELSRLADAGVLSRTSIGNQVHFQANPACPIFEELRGIIKKTSGIADVLREALEPLSARIHAAFIYGSIARGDLEDRKIFIIGGDDDLGKPASHRKAEGARRAKG